jgi:hypothetical protein
VYAEDAVFVSPGGITHGRAAVAERYRKRYPDRAAMGTLRLEAETVRVLSETVFDDLQNARPAAPHAVVLAGKWQLSYPNKPAAAGSTQLVLFRRGGTWEIVSDASM